MPDRLYYVYILASASCVLYTGVTSNLRRRVSQHKKPDPENPSSTFTHKYQVTQLMHVEVFRDVRTAIAREKQIKAWTRAKRVALIERRPSGYVVTPELSTRDLSFPSDRDAITRFGGKFRASERSLLEGRTGRPKELQMSSNMESILSRMENLRESKEINDLMLGSRRANLWKLWEAFQIGQQDRGAHRISGLFSYVKCAEFGTAIAPN